MQVFFIYEVALHTFKMVQKVVASINHSRIYETIRDVTQPFDIIGSIQFSSSEPKGIIGRPECQLWSSELC